MKTIAIILMLTAALLTFTAFSSADSISIGEISLSSPDIEMDELLINAKKATFTAPDAKIKADNIRVELKTQKNGNITIGKSTASGNVSIEAKQKDKNTKASSTIKAKADKAVMIAGQDTITLTGNVVLDVIYPGFTKPAVIKGDVVTIYLSVRKIHVQGSGDKQSELKAPLKEVEKK